MKDLFFCYSFMCCLSLSLVFAGFRGGPSDFNTLIKWLIYCCIDKNYQTVIYDRK